MNPGIWLADTILAFKSKILPDDEISITMLVFILDYFQEKLTRQNFFKNPKSRISGPFLALSAKILAKMDFPGKKGFVSF